MPFVRRCRFESDLRELHLHLLRDEHWNRRVRALPHFDVRHDERHAAVTTHTDECVRREDFRNGTTGRFAAPDLSWKDKSQEKSTAGDCTDLEKGPA